VPRIKAYQGKLYPLHVGDTWLEPPPTARTETLTTADNPLLHTYPPPHGEPALLAAIADRLQRRFGVERSGDAIQVTSGATSGLSVTVQALCDPGDEVLLPAPFWPLIRGIIASRGARPVQVPFYTRLGEANFDPEATLEAAITERTVAIYVNTPNNPTGRTLTEAQLDGIARVARRHGLWILTDEVYEDLYFSEAPPATLWRRADVADRTIAHHSLSKAYGLAGARVGYTHGPADVIATIRGVNTFQVYSAAKPMERLAARALIDGDAWLAECRRLYARQARAASQALGLPMPQGGTFLFFDATPWLDGAPTALPLLERCVDAGVVLVPGAASGEGYERWVRLCYTTVGPDDLDEALRRLQRVLGSSS
jgi:N-succinyldiaminopimelate aminotransferase